MKKQKKVERKSPEKFVEAVYKPGITEEVNRESANVGHPEMEPYEGNLDGDWQKPEEAFYSDLGL